MPAIPTTSQVLQNTMSMPAPSFSDLVTSSTSAFTSTANSALTSASTTPHLASDGTLHSYKFERSAKCASQSDCEDEGQETDNTVIHYSNEETTSQHTLNDADFSAYAKGYIDSMNFELEQDYDNTTKILDGHTRRNLSIEDITDSYIFILKQSQVDLKNEIQRAFEEFKFDIITDHLSPPNESIYYRTASGPNRTTSEHIGRHVYESLDGGEETVSIRLSDTPYLILLHSIRPQLMSFSILSFLRKKLHLLEKRTILSLLTLAVSIINMANNSNEGLKLYSKMLIYRTQKLTYSLLQLERFLSTSVSAKNQAKRYNLTIGGNNNSSKRAKLTLISSAIHLLISVFVKRIGKMITYISNVGSLWKYIAVYGLDGDFDEIRIVRNIIQNPESCSCTWSNEPERLVRVLQYVRKMSLCIILSLMEVEENEEKDNVKATIFMKNFWSNFGFESVNWNVGSPTLATRLLGMCTCVEEFTTFVDLMKGEIVAEEVQLVDSNEPGELSEEFNENSRSDNIYGLGVLRERNEDERIRELSSMVGKVGYKLDLIELGMDSKEGIFTLKSDIDELVRCYNEVTSGKAFRRNENTTTKDKDLKRLRMSEILLDDFDGAAEKSRRNRRSSGIDLKLFSVVKTTDEVKPDRCEIVQADERSSDTEFRKTLERLCLDRGAKAISRTGNKDVGEVEAEADTDLAMTRTGKTHTEEAAFLEFKNELRKRLEEERL